MIVCACLQKYPYAGMRVVFSGVRDPGVEDLVTQLGGTASSSAVSSRTTLVVVKDLQSNTTKVKTACRLGIKIQSYYTFKTQAEKALNKFIGAKQS